MARQLVIAGTYAQFKDWLSSKGLNSQSYVYVGDPYKLRGVERGTEILLVGAYYQSPAFRDVCGWGKFTFKREETERDCSIESAMESVVKHFSIGFCLLVGVIKRDLHDCAEKSAGLQKLLEAEDCFIKAEVFWEGKTSSPYCVVKKLSDGALFRLPNYEPVPDGYELVQAWPIDHQYSLLKRVTYQNPDSGNGPDIDA